MIMSDPVWVGAVAYDPKVVTIWEGMRRYFVEEARLPVEVVLFQSYEAQVQALLASPDDRPLRFNSDVGKHGDTGKSEVEVIRAVLDGRADAGAVGSPFWKTMQNERLVPEGALREIWTSPPYNHCMFTARPDLEPALERQFADALSGMNYENPSHRAVLEAEGLRRWVVPDLEGYDALRKASRQQGFFGREAI